jgi:hypothetical protein
MRKICLIPTVACLLVALTIINAIPASAGTLIITPPQGGQEDPGQVEPPADQQDPGQVEPPADQEDPGPVITTIEVVIPQVADEELYRAAERAPSLAYIPEAQISEPQT